MIRWWLLGGTRPEAPWELLVALGGALAGASILFVLLFPLWSTYPWVGVLETGGFAVVASVLLAVGFLRRSRGYGFAKDVE